MKCYIVNDLLPEYIEKLCSEETSKEIETHIAGCKKCQEKLKSMTVGKEPTNSESDSSVSAPAANNPFLKIQKKIKAEKIKKRLLIIGIAVISFIFIFLTVGQIFPQTGIPNYDTMKYHYKAKQIAKDFLAGNTEVILDGMNNMADQAPNANMDIFGNEAALYSEVNSELKKLQSELIDGKNVKIGLTNVTYNEYDGYYSRKTTSNDTYIASYTASITLESEDVHIPLQIDFLSDDAYYVSFSYGNETPSQTLQNFDKYCTYYFRALLGNETPNYILGFLMRPNRNTTTFNLLYHFVTYDCTSTDRNPDADIAYQSKVDKSLTEIYNKQETVSIELVNLTYNTDTKCIDSKLFWEIHDLNGNYAIMVKEFNYGPFGFEPKDDSEIIYADDNFDSELLNDLMEVFDK